MTTVDHITTRQTPTLSRQPRRLIHHLAKPGWVIMTILSLVTIAFVVRYLAFNPDTYFPEQRQVYQQREFILGVHVLSGMLAQRIGAPRTVMIGGICCILGAAAFERVRPSLRKLVEPIYIKRGILPQVAVGMRDADVATQNVAG